jgi:hypothetical protein
MVSDAVFIIVWFYVISIMIIVLFRPRPRACPSAYLRLHSIARVWVDLAEAFGFCFGLRFG